VAFHDELPSASQNVRQTYAAFLFSVSDWILLLIRSADRMPT
jgi:hypothetical protein